MNKKIVIFSLILLLLLSGCPRRLFDGRGNGGETGEDFTDYCNSGAGIYFSHPESWTKISESDAGVAFANSEDLDSQEFILTASRSKGFEDVEYDILDDLVDALLDVFEGTSNYSKLSDSQTTIDNVPARDITISYSDEEEEVKVRFIITEKHEGYFYKIALFSPPELFDEANETFEKIVESFRSEC